MASIILYCKERNLKFSDKIKVFNTEREAIDYVKLDIQNRKFKVDNSRFPEIMEVGHLYEIYNEENTQAVGLIKLNIEG